MVSYLVVTSVGLPDEHGQKLIPRWILIREGPCTSGRCVMDFSYVITYAYLMNDVDGPILSDSHGPSHQRPRMIKIHAGAGPH